MCVSVCVSSVVNLCESSSYMFGNYLDVMQFVLSNMLGLFWFMFILIFHDGFSVSVSSHVWGERDTHIIDLWDRIP